MVGIVTVIVLLLVVKAVIHYLFYIVSSTFNLLALVQPTCNEHLLHVWDYGWWIR